MFFNFLDLVNRFKQPLLLNQENLTLMELQPDGEIPEKVVKFLMFYWRLELEFGRIQIVQIGTEVLIIMSQKICYVLENQAKTHVRYFFS